MATRSESRTVELARKALFSVRNSQFIYEHMINFREKRMLTQLIGNVTLAKDHQSILSELRSDGIAVRNMLAVFPNHELRRLSDWITANEGNLMQKEKKKFLFSYFGTDDPNKRLDFQNPFVQFYLDEKLLKIVASYLGYVPQLYEIYVEKTVPSELESPQFSQNWHRDPEEKRTLKVFLYLNTVDEQSGPFVYIRRSNPSSQSSYSKLFKQKLPHGSYPKPEEVSRFTDISHHFIATGISGTIIFCDTAGIHRGGHAISGHRIMSTAFFPSKHYSQTRRFSIDENELPNKLGPLARTVLGLS